MASMTLHVVYLVLMITSQGYPKVVATEPTLDLCMRDVQQSAQTMALGSADWYCQAVYTVN